MSEIIQGLEVSLLGVLITFTALGGFVLIMIGLQKLFPEREHGEAELSSRNAPDEPERAETTAQEEEKEEGEVAAAIAVALLYFQSQKQGGLGEALNEGKGPWWSLYSQAARHNRLQSR